MKITFMSLDLFSLTLINIFLGRSPLAPPSHGSATVADLDYEFDSQYRRATVMTYRYSKSQRQRLVGPKFVLICIQIEQLVNVLL